MNCQSSLWTFSHRWGLDIFTGSAGWSLFILSTQGIHKQWLITYLVGLSAWLCYSLDRIIDVRRFFNHRNIPQRYIPFIERQRLWLVLITLAVPTALSFAYSLLSFPMLLIGLILSSVCLIYLLYANRLNSIMKQLYAAVLFTAGIALPLFEHNLTFGQIYPYIASLYLMVAAHTLSSAYWDIDFDEASRSSKFQASYHKITSKMPQISLWSGLCMLLLSFKVLNPYWAASLALTLISLALIEKSKVLKTPDLKRTCADSIFAVIPWIFLALQAPWSISFS